METEEQPNLIQRLKDKISGKEVTALGGEIGTGIGLDMATQKLLYGGPKGWAAYGVINFAGGAGANYAAQQYRTEEDLAWYDRDWGEIISSGLLGIIPGTTAKAGKFTRFVGNPNTYRRVATFGAAQGITDQFIRQGIDEGRLPTGSEIATGGITGSVAGPVFKKSFDEIGKIFTKYRGKSAEEINSLMTDRERSSISYFKKQIVANRDNPKAALELIERMKESNFNYRKNVLGLHKNFKDYATFKDSKDQIVNSINEKIDGDLRPDFTLPIDLNTRISNLGGRGFAETSELTRAGIHPLHHKGDKLYNYPEIPEGGEFLWYGKRDVDVPTPKGVPVDLGDGLIASKNDIDLSTFDLSDPAKVSKQFEDLLRQSLEIDQIGMKHLSHIGQKRSKVIEGQTGEQTIGLMWNDYLAGYFNKFIRSGKATNFDEAVRVKLPNGRVLKGDATLARELRLWTIKPEVINTGFTKGGTAPSSRQYQRDLARIVNNHNPGQDPNFSNKFHAHHINVIEEEWPLVRGLNSPELIKMRKLLDKHIKYPSGNEIGNRLIVLDEIHNKIHADYWPQYAAEFREIVNDPNFNTLYPTAASREELVIMFGEIVEKMMNEAILPDIDAAIRKAHLKYKFRISDDNVTNYVDEILDEIEFERSRSIEKSFDDDLYERPFSKEELEAGQGITDDPFK